MKNNKNKIFYLSIGLCFGISYGVIFKNLSIGLIVGLCFGLVLNNINK